MKLMALGALTLPFLFLLESCPSPASPTPPLPTSSVSLTMNSTSSAEVNAAASALSSGQRVNVNLDLGAGAHQVYFVFTNESTASTLSMPTVAGDIASSSTAKSVASQSITQGATVAPSVRGVNLGAPPEILAANQTVLQKISAPPAGARSVFSITPSFDSAPTTGYTVGTTSTTYYPYGYTSGGSVAAISCTLQHVVDQSAGASKRKLFVWVDNNCFDATATSGHYTYAVQVGTSIPFKVNASQVQAIADAFLNGTGNDIYDYVTAIYGKEYPDSGTVSPGTGLITPRGEIHIFIVDLNPSSTSKGNGGTLGYFYGGDNIQAGYGYADTNEKIMFQLDAEMLGNPNPDGSLAGLSVGTNQPSPAWSTTTSFWPNEMLSTLAHEFQHMIHFYQKQVKNSPSSATVTWVNEMASMVTEDFVAKKIGTLGPRGAQFNANGSFSYVDGTGSLYSGGAGNDPGARLAFFNYYYPTVGLQTWGDVTTGSLANYGVAYAFGAWLARNYGGPELFHRIVTNGNTDETAVTDAVNSLNATNLTMPQLLEQWAAAMLMGPHGDGAVPYSMISTSSSLYSPASVNYGPGAAQSFTYGSIDPTKYYSYDYATNTPYLPGGPRIFTSTSGVSAIPARAFYYYTPDGGGATTGTKSYTVTLPANVQLQVVTVPSP